MIVFIVQVMRAEAEAAEEVDSAFGSNRSVLGNSSFSPADASPKPRIGGGKEEEEEEEEEEDEEEGVVSWASVRMLGDKQRQKAPKEEDEVFSLLLQGWEVKGQNNPSSAPLMTNSVQVMWPVHSRSVLTCRPALAHVALSGLLSTCWSHVYL